MLVMTTDDCPLAHCTPDGQLVVLLTSRHPITGKSVESAVIKLSAHQALCLSHSLMEMAEQVIKVESSQSGTKADIINLKSQFKP
ncbi:hypothetical protein Hbal_1649 [Hirschia baltica ATCC 49814]|uniref:Uncharacterized protein n=1 Tax=Hirschia baltica (strain ATCC 49814 / DSM 5838 / IFAM 1418) TaxID=582402 RepID=C6XJP2_HIRBI|nr:hypothetical protein Hbal_1649 [Hirschia baltica ATCC 49814]